MQTPFNVKGDDTCNTYHASKCEIIMQRFLEF